MIRFYLFLLLQIFPVENRSFQSRSIGGTPVKKGQEPWLVLITAKVANPKFLWQTKSYVNYHCSGFVISDYWILTAAHCFKYRNELKIPRYWTVTVATNKLQDDNIEKVFSYFGNESNPTAWDKWHIKPSRIKIHPYFDPRKHLNDIALMKLSSKAPLGTNVHILELPSSDDEFPVGTVCYISGWGCTEQGGTMSTVARTLSMPILPDSSCFEVYRRSMDKKICAGHFNSGTGVCSGDSGGPLVCVKNNTNIAAGTLSSGSKYYEKKYPAVFTKISSYLFWIKKYVT